MCECGFPDALTTVLFDRDYYFSVLHIWYTDDDAMAFHHTVDTMNDPTYETKGLRIL